MVSEQHITAQWTYISFSDEDIAPGNDYHQQFVPLPIAFQSGAFASVGQYSYRVNSGFFAAIRYFGRDSGYKDVYSFWLRNLGETNITDGNVKGLHIGY